MRCSLVVTIVLALLGCCAGFGEEQVREPLTNPRTLVVLGDQSTSVTHSAFLAAFAVRGHDVTVSVVGSKGVTHRLHDYGDYHFDNLVLMAPAAKSLGPHLTVKELVAFVDDGRNVLVVADDEPSIVMRNFARECGVTFHKSKNLVHDNVFADGLLGDDKHRVVSTTQHIDSSVILGSFVDSPAPILFRGIAHTLASSSFLLTTILTGEASAYSGTSSTSVLSRGRSTLLVSALQARNNARVTFAGSLAMFSDAYFVSPVHTLGGTTVARSGNEVFCTELALWTFKERGFIRAREVRHHLIPHPDNHPGGNPEDMNPAGYRIKDHIAYHVSLEEFDWRTRDWQPFQKDDVQLELHRLDPFIRLPLVHDDKGHFEAQFQLPHVFGVYQLKIDYKRVGYSTLLLQKQISVRPFNHDEYQRFLPLAFPYYTGAFSMMAGSFVFGLVLLYNKNA